MLREREDNTAFKQWTMHAAASLHPHCAGWSELVDAVSRHGDLAMTRGQAHYSGLVNLEENNY